MRSAPTFPYCHMAKVAAARTIYQSFTSHSGACGFCELVENQFLEGLAMDCASAQAAFGSLAFLSATPLKTANPQPLVSKIWAFS